MSGKYLPLKMNRSIYGFYTKNHPRFTKTQKGETMEIKHTEFKTYLLNSKGIARVLEARQILDKALTDVENLFTPAWGIDIKSFAGVRELAITRTKFEEAGMFVIKAISLQPQNQIQDEGGKL
jgi:hypothetical protein